MAKAKTMFVCTNCGAEYTRWQGQCKACGEWNSIEEVHMSGPAAERSAVRSLALGGFAGMADGKVENLANVQIAQTPRLHTGYGEFDRVLGGGIVPGSVVLIGGNPGAGKSTLFRMITGIEKPDSGEIKLGDTVVTAYVEQFRDDMKDDNTVFEEIAHGQDILRIGNYEIPSRAYIGRFNFKSTDQQKRVGDLSGGERGRLQLAKLLQVGGNLLLLDEPTNDLDVETLRALENALLEFPGSAMVISHDRWFLDRIATHILDYGDEGKVRFFEGNYTEYEAWKKKELGEEAQPHRLKFKKVSK